jgi:CRP-like cAMP-binding protein/small-conductance mechanosensitive channel
MRASLTLTAALAAGLVVTAFLVGKLAPANRRRVRRAVFLFAFYLLSFGAARALGAARVELWAQNADYVAELFAALTFVNVGGILLFDLVLPLIGLGVAEIVADLMVGAAYLVASVVVLRAAGVNLSGIIATSAVVTGVLGLSLQATLGNILGGVALQLDDSIHVGDWIQLEGGRQGKVTEIRWRHTVVETRDWDTIIVPNATLLAQNITILGKRAGQPIQHRMWIYFNVDYRYSPAEVIRVVNEALQAAPMAGVALDPAPHAICYDFARDRRDSMAYYAVRYWLTDLARDDPTSPLVRLRIFSALRRAGIPLAVPAATIFVSNDDPQHAERKAHREMERRLAAIDGVEIFAPMTREEKQDLAQRIRSAPFMPGETITRQGAVAHWFYVLTRGECEVRVRNDAGEESVLTELSAPSFFGEMGMMTGARRTATVVAKTEVECFRIDKADFDAILQERPEIATEVSRILAERRVGLVAAREGLDADARRSRTELEQHQILTKIRSFFGLDGDTRAA